MKNKRVFKFWSILLSMVMCFSTYTCSAFAAENLSEETSSVEVQNIEEAGISRQKALEVLGLTAEEAEGVDFYALTSSNQRVFESGDVYTFPTFTFTNNNIGSYFTVNATKLIYGIVWQVPADQPAATLDVELYPSGEPRAYNIHLSTTSDRVGTQVLRDSSGWINTYYGVDYHFVYKAAAWYGDPRSVTSSVTVIIGVS